MNRHQLTYIQLHPQAIKPRREWRDVATAIVIGLALAVGALTYFDVLFY